MESICKTLEYEGHDEDCIREIQVCTDRLLRDKSYTDESVGNCVTANIPSVLRDRNDTLSRERELKQTCQGYPILECYFKMQNCKVKAQRAGYVVLDMVTDDYVYECARKDVPKEDIPSPIIRLRCGEYVYDKDCEREGQVCTRDLEDQNQYSWQSVHDCLDARAPVVDRERNKILSRELELERICTGFSHNIDCYFEIQECKVEAKNQGHDVKDAMTDPNVVACVSDKAPKLGDGHETGQNIES